MLKPGRERLLPRSFPHGLVTWSVNKILQQTKVLKFKCALFICQKKKTCLLWFVMLFRLQTYPKNWNGFVQHACSFTLFITCPISINSLTIDSASNYRFLLDDHSEYSPVLLKFIPNRKWVQNVRKQGNLERMHPGNTFRIRTWHVHCNVYVCMGSFLSRSTVYIYDLWQTEGDGHASATLLVSLRLLFYFNKHNRAFIILDNQLIKKNYNKNLGKVIIQLLETLVNRRSMFIFSSSWELSWLTACDVSNTIYLSINNK